MASAPQTLKLSDLAAFGAAPSSSPVQPKPLTMQDLQAYGAQQDSGPSIAADAVKYSPLGMVKGLADMITTAASGKNPLAGVADANEQMLEKAKASFGQGHYADATGHFINYLIPGGSAFEDIQDDLRNGNYGHAAAKFGGLASSVVLPEKAPEIVEGVKSGAAKVAGAVNAVTRSDPALDLIKAYNPRDQRFIDKVPDAAADIKAVSGKNTLNNEDVIAAAPAARQANRQAWQQWTNQGRQMSAQASGVPIIQATQDSLASTLDPGARADILDEAKRIYGNGPLTTDQLEELLHEKNGELKPFYSKDEATRSAAEAAGARTGRSQTLLEGQSDAIRDTLYKMLDPDNGGAGPREIQQRYGAISTLEDEAWANRNRILAEHSGTPVGKAVSTLAAAVSAPGKIATGNVEGAVMDIPAALRGKTDPIVMRAFKNTGASNPLPTPPLSGPRQWVSTGSGPRALPAAPIATPPPADTSFVRGVPAMAQPPNPARALPPGTTPIVTPPPADTSFVRGAPAMTQPPNPARALPPATTRITGPPETSGLEVFDAARQIARDPKTGRMFRYYTSGRAPRPLSDLEMKTVAK